MGPLLLCFLVGCTAPLVDDDDDDATGDDDDATGAPDDDPWFCDAPALQVTADGAGWRVIGPRTDLWTVGTADRARDLGSLLELALPSMEGWFGEALPADRLPIRVELHASEADMLASIAAAGVDKPVGAGGFYHPTPQVSWLYQQPTRYYTQVLLLHEVTHQVQDLLRGAGGDERPAWWVEGVAEYLGRHDWDGDCARVAQRPLGSVADIDRSALNDVIGGLTLDDVLNGGGGRSAWYGLIAYLDRGHEGMEQLRRVLDDEGTDDAGAALFDAFGDVADGWQPWLQAHQQPLEASYQEWVHRGPDSMIGISGNVITARARAPASEFAVVVPGPSDGASGGVLAAWESDDSWFAVLAAEDGIWSFDVTPSGAVWNRRADLPPEPGPHGVRSRPVATGTELQWGSVTFVLEHELPWAAGLAMSGGEVAFEGIEGIR